MVFLSIFFVLLIFFVFSKREKTTEATYRQWPVQTYNCDAHCSCGHSPMVVVDDDHFFCERCGCEFEQ